MINYTLLRWITCSVAAYVAYLALKINNTAWLIVFVVIALLFNPIIPVYLKRETWAFIDIGTAALFIVSIFTVKPEERGGENA